MNIALLFTLIASTICAAHINQEPQNKVNISITTQAVEKMKLLVGVIEPDVQLMQTATLLKQMLERSKASLSGFAIKIISISARA